ncbi:MAG: endolytic transglycosylase MltG [Ignavibacteriaceae bacterium]
MDNLINKIENELESLSIEERHEILRKLRDNVDELDKEIVHLISKRTLHSVLIGRVKRSMNLATYNPQREKEISQRISSFVEQPLGKEALLRIYERILDESRAIQREELNKGNIFNISANKMKIGINKLLSRKEFFIIAAFFFFVLSILLYSFFSPNYYKGNSPVEFVVQKGETLSQITNDLYSEDIITGKIKFRIAAFLLGAERRIRPARYYIPNGLSYVGLVDYFMNGKADYLKSFLILSGSNISAIASRLQSETFIDSSAIVKLSTDRDFLDSLGLHTDSFLGYMLPEKYDIFERSSPSEALKIIYKGFQNFMVDSLKQRARKLGYTIPQIVTLASIVEGETNKKSEMPLIASVYLNRLKTGMKLQADPTVEFLQPGKWKRLYYNDLKINSPYNTYEHDGLPPGPINNPGKSAILATLYPAHTDYLYFVANGKGGHNFSSNYKDHLQNVDHYKLWLNSLKKN